MQKKKFIKKFKENLLLKYLQFIIVLLSSFFLIPYYLGNFSFKIYGAWLLVSTITSWLMLLDPGSSNLIIQQISRSIALKKDNKLPAIIISGIINTFFVASIILIIGIFLYTDIIYYFIESINLANKMYGVFLVTICSLSVMLIFHFFVGIMEGYNKPRIAGLSFIFLSVTKILLVILLIENNYGIISLPLSDLISGLLITILIIIYFLFNISLFIKKLDLTFNLYKDYTSLYFYNFSSRISKILTNGGLDNLLIVKFISIETITVYNLIQTIQKKIETLISVGFSASRTSLAYLSGSLSNNNYLKFKLRNFFAISTIFIFIIYLLFDLINPFINLWLNINLKLDTLIINLVILFSSLRIFSNYINIINFSEGKIKEVNKIQIIGSVLLIPIIFILTKFFKLEGLIISHILILILILIFFGISIYFDISNKKNTHKVIIFKFLINLLISTFCSTAIYSFIKDVLKITLDTWSQLIFISCLKIFILFFILFIFNKFFREEILYICSHHKMKPINKWKI